MGQSGCGKSTVLKLLMCLYPLDQGRRYINEDELTTKYRRMFAYVPQGNILMNLRSLTDKTVIIITHRKAVLSICDWVMTFGEEGNAE